MLTNSGPKVLEFNCRLGDPEAQAILARLDFDLAEILSDVAGERFDPLKLRWKLGASACVVLTSGGYPGKFEKSKRIEGLTAAAQINGVKILHAGTKLAGETVVTNGGWGVGGTATTAPLDAASAPAYQGGSRNHFVRMDDRKGIR